MSPPSVLLTADGNTVSVTNSVSRIATASPDLGIESDQGRFSSLEPHPLKKSTTAPALNTPNDLAVAVNLRSKFSLNIIFDFKRKICSTSSILDIPLFPKSLF